MVIGAGAAGEAAANMGASLGAKVAVVEEDLVGGLCAYWACMPSKSLLDSASRRALGAGYSWERAAERRDWMINKSEGHPTDKSAVEKLERAGVKLFRGKARITGPGRVEASENGSLTQTLECKSIICATGSVPIIPKVEGLEEAGYWTNREGTALDDIPSSIVVLGGGPMGVELSQVYARFGSKVTVVCGSSDRVLPRDHQASSAAVTKQLEMDGVRVLTGASACKVTRGGAGRIVDLSDGSKVEAAELLVAVGRRPSDLSALGVEEAGATLGEELHDEQMRIGESVFVAGDAAAGLQFTHIADYEGRVAAKAALGRDARIDLTSVPKATYTDPETAAVGLTVEEAREQGIDAFEVTQDFATTARGYTIEGSFGHVTAVVDRERGLLVGAFAAAPRASELIHEAVLGIKLKVPVSVLADTITAFPTGARVFGNLMYDAIGQMS
ncbi:MAG TPA: NAD(P)/FAD-dependent oxidoreductase [Actinomycetota bacterium]|nr:NAD(P)/FAD-dependent oxidoreductase [Actinomycetota bacterium]